ncbi:aminoglycoside adenylyltransferase family protein [Halomonas huangheensis]|uniref:Aminoglycoside (3'') (9) adenylyltransferase n=1 Tax=Halomonas huangheensis TaxID=1178482 RepID=W1N274_9GAMM|nr:aminoglycoside adenylyltransferase family protein [Halomonas huangheensis]ALM51256.1 hypothetical protein AR456_02320 [Halomonas huangheensis]ERL49682.1 hypothetical protein BJB45_00760 [Halomonas huangheensis]
MTSSAATDSLPPDIRALLASIQLVLQRYLSDSLIAVYLHGSAVTSGLRRDSDVDVLVVVEQPLTPALRQQLVTELLAYSASPEETTGLRPLEVMIFRRTELVNLRYPACSEFVYGEWLREELEMGSVPGVECEPELTLVLAQARQEALPLVGPALAELVPIITRAQVRRATGDLLPSLLAGLQGDERNVLLTLARMWRTLEVGDFVSKDVAAQWALTRSPAEHGKLLEYARQAYLGIISDHWQVRESESLSTARYLLSRVERGL